MKISWNGVMPAITTAFNQDLSVDFSFVTEHAQWLVSKGCTGIVVAGSLGEGATLSFAEKVTLWESVARAVGTQVPVIAAIASASTNESVTLAKAAKDKGCTGLMVLPPYIYSTDWPEMKAYIVAVMNATDLSCLLYNNPIAYKTDFLPHQIQELAYEQPHFHAVKESSADIRRIAALRALLKNRLSILVGVDDAIVEGVKMGADGWIAGVVNALPEESVTLFESAKSNSLEKTMELYEWMLPLLRMDTVPKLVQLIKLIQEQAGIGSARVRPPRLPLVGAELESALDIIRDAFKKRVVNTKGF